MEASERRVDYELALLVLEKRVVKFSQDIEMVSPLEVTGGKSCRQGLSLEDSMVTAAVWMSMLMCFV